LSLATAAAAAAVAAAAADVAVVAAADVAVVAAAVVAVADAAAVDKNDLGYIFKDLAVARISRGAFTIFDFSNLTTKEDILITGDGREIVMDRGGRG
jgi:hypothetical protein